MSKTISGVVTWLKGWFYDKDEITAKEQALQTQINNKASTSDLNTTNTNVSNLSSNKADKTNGASQITDSNAGNYTNISDSLTSSSTQQAINTAINSAIGNLTNVELVTVVQTLPEPSSSTVNKLYVVSNNGGIIDMSEEGGDNDLYDIYITVHDGSLYQWEKIDDFNLQDLSIEWSDVANKPFTTVDNSLSSSSTNPVQNKVIYGELSKKISNIESGTSSQLNTWVQNGGEGFYYLVDGDNSILIYMKDSIIISIPDYNMISSFLNEYAVKNHADATTTYGVGTTNKYGHNKVINDLTHSSFTNGESLSAYQGYVLNQLISDKADADDAITSISLVDKSTDSTGKIIFYTGDEPT